VAEVRAPYRNPYLTVAGIIIPHPAGRVDGNGVVGWEVVSAQVKEESQIGEWFVLEAL
jgi:hypothetical protein